MNNGCRGAVAALVLVLTLTVPAYGHLERPSYWPDPAPDTSVDPPAGGAVPKARSLASAVTGAGPGEVRVVCQRSSLRAATRAIRVARRKGFRIRPSQPKISYSRKKARKMRRLNKRLFARCDFDSVQAAVNASGNNDRVVVMPGVYTEPASRAAPKEDPRCNPSMLQKDASGDATPSYEYQSTCPNDQNLVYVQGRALKGKPLENPRSDRRGIPEQELGACVRCNLQIEGSGPRPTDTIIDAGTDYTGKGPEAKPGGHAKDVVLRVDRADGFVGRNFTVRGAKEHGFYNEEVDGILLDRMKFFWNLDYGHLSFTSDHGRLQNCDGMGAGDAALYPGAAPDTGSQATDFYPDAPRFNTVITKCDMRHSQLGYSGSMGNAVRITGNHIYGNATGLASDTLSSAGHPGFPTDSIQIDGNYFYSNNFNVYAPDSPVKPLVTVPVGTGIIWAGVNDGRVFDNWFFDNWRDGVMLFAVPDALTSYGGPEGDVYPGVSCRETAGTVSTSCGNRFFDNKMGRIPPGFTWPAGIGRYGNPYSSERSQTAPNGNDFWWDEFTSNRANCWYGNTGPDGSTASVTGPGEAGRSAASPPQTLPDCAGGEDPDSSRGLGDPAKTQYLVDCSEGPDQETSPMACDWWFAPPKPTGAEARRRRLAFAGASRDFARTSAGQRILERIDALIAGG